MPHYYIEADGQIFLLEEAHRLRFPRQPEEIPFAIEINHTMRIGTEEVHHCKPRLKQHPTDWHHKDEIAGMEHVDPLVRLAVNMSLPRVTAKAVIVKDGKLLMVKPNRGYNAGRWTLPGGFVSYGERPDAAAAREAAEETGVPCRITAFVAADSVLGVQTSYHWYTFFYAAVLETEAFDPPEDEIDEVAWVPVPRALEVLAFYGGLRDQLRQYIESLGHERSD